MQPFYLWFKAFHITFVVAYFAGLFYLPRLFVYHADARDTISHDRFVIMGSGAEVVQETVEAMNGGPSGSGEKVGLLKVRLYRPFSSMDMVRALPASTRTIAVLDRTKEPGASGEPLYKDVVTAIAEAFTAGSLHLKKFPKIIGGRYGLSSKEFTPAMIKGVYDEMKAELGEAAAKRILSNAVIKLAREYDIQADQAEADKVVAQAKAEMRRAAAVASYLISRGVPSARRVFLLRRDRQ